MELTLRLHDAPQPELSESPIGRVPEAVRAWAWIETHV
jgi:hypothetical protein